MESLEFDLCLKPVLGLHHHVNHLKPVIVPFLNAPEVSGPALVVNDEGHGAMLQAFLKENESANTAVSILEGKDLPKAHMEIHDVVDAVDIL